MSIQDVVLRVEERESGWWVVIDGGPDDLMPPQLRECGPAPSEADARAHVEMLSPVLAELLGVDKVLVGNPWRN